MTSLTFCLNMRAPLPDVYFVRRNSLIKWPLFLCMFLFTASFAGRFVACEAVLSADASVVLYNVSIVVTCLMSLTISAILICEAVRCVTRTIVVPGAFSCRKLFGKRVCYAFSDVAFVKFCPDIFSDKLTFTLLDKDGGTICSMSYPEYANAPYLVAHLHCADVPFTH